MRCNDDE
jgi:hypothetical protein